jgi:hypothetical protein
MRVGLQYNTLINGCASVFVAAAQSHDRKIVGEAEKVCG